MSLHQTLRVSNEKLKALKELVPLEKHKERLFEIDKLLELGNVWDNPRKAGELAKERQKLSDIVEKLKLWQDGVDEDLEYCTAFAEEAEKELGENASTRLVVIEKFELLQLFRDPMDGNAAILSINAGAGGLEACDFASMLLRMYSRYCDANGFKAEIIDMKETDGGYIDSVTIMVSGEYAFGYLKGETGTHRLVRNSPFNSGNARHTSFAGVRVLPDIDDTIDIKIEDKDLEVYGQVGGGGPKAGGQARNKTASACRLRHFPSGIAFVICTERSYHDNLRTAMKLLKAKLYEIEVQKKNAIKDAVNSSLTDMAFGSQIRSYVLQPQTHIKDHRTKHERTDAEAVLDGDIQDFLEATLRMTT